MPARSSRRRTPRDARQQLEPAAPEEQRTRFGRPLTVGPMAATAGGQARARGSSSARGWRATAIEQQPESRPRGRARRAVRWRRRPAPHAQLERDGRIGRARASRARRASRLPAPARVARPRPCRRAGDLEGGLGVAAGGAAATAAIGRGSACRPTSARNSSTRRRSRCAVMRLADDLAGREQGQVGDLARTSARARSFSASMSAGPACAAARARRGSRRCRARALVGDLLGALEDLLRLAARLGQHGQALVGGRLALAARGVGVLQALLDARAALLEHPADAA